jgi:hypothetical protein
MVQIDPNAPSRFLAIGFEPGDWVAVLVKSHETGETAQRVLPVSVVAAPRAPVVVVAVVVVMAISPATTD